MPGDSLPEAEFSTCITKENRYEPDAGTFASFGSGIPVIGVWGKPEKPEAGGGDFYGFCPIFFM